MMFLLLPPPKKICFFLNNFLEDTEIHWTPSFKLPASALRLQRPPNPGEPAGNYEPHPETNSKFAPETLGFFLR